MVQSIVIMKLWLASHLITCGYALNELEMELFYLSWFQNCSGNMKYWMVDFPTLVDYDCIV